METSPCNNSRLALRRSCVAALFVAILQLSSCGGGGGGDATPPPPPPTPVTPVPSISLFAGAFGGPGYADGSPGRMAAPIALATNSSGHVFVVDGENCNVRKIVDSTLSTVLGAASCNEIGPDGAAVPSVLRNLSSVAVDGAGSLYFSRSDQALSKVAPDGSVTTLAADVRGRFALRGNDSIYEIRLNSIYKYDVFGTRTLLAGDGMSTIGFADGVGADARFYQLSDLAIAGDGTIYVTDSFNHAIRKVSPSGAVTTVAGAPSRRGTADGPVQTAQFLSPRAIAVDLSGNLYVAEATTVRKISTSGVVTTIAGVAGAVGSADGEGSAARFASTGALATDGNGNVYVADTGNGTVRRISGTGVVTTVAGVAAASGAVDGLAKDARFSGPRHLSIDNAGNLFVADVGNATVRKVDPRGSTTTYAGITGRRGTDDGPVSVATFYSPVSTALDKSGNVYVADLAYIKQISPAGIVRTFKLFPANFRAYDQPFCLAIGSQNQLYALATSLSGTGPMPYATTVSAGGEFSEFRCGARCFPSAVVADNSGNVFMATRASVRRVAADGTVTVLAGDAEDQNRGYIDGTGAQARFNSPSAIAVDSKGNIYLAEPKYNVIRKVTPSGVVTTLAGNRRAQGAAAGPLPGTLNAPSGIAIDSADNIYVTTENAIVKITQ